MNFDYKKVGEHTNTSDILNVFFSQSLLPTVSRQTRIIAHINNTSATVIDNSYNSYISDIPDHYAILVVG